MEDFFFGWRFELSCCQPKIPPATSVRKDTGRVHVFFAPCRVDTGGVFPHGFKDSCVFFLGGGVPETLTKKWMFPGFFWDASGGKILILKFDEITRPKKRPHIAIGISE